MHTRDCHTQHFREKIDHVSFWIQEMEAWFLKQPESIELWAEDEGLTRKKGPETPLSEHPSIRDKDIEHLQQKASFLMGVILRQVFAPQEKAKKSATGKVRDLKYGKLRHAPGIIHHRKCNHWLWRSLGLCFFVSSLLVFCSFRSKIAPKRVFLVILVVFSGSCNDGLTFFIIFVALILLSVDALNYERTVVKGIPLL